ncbi:MAG: serine hydrolase domain-containing protein [Actinomycetota bacterium]
MIRSLRAVAALTLAALLLGACQSGVSRRSAPASTGALPVVDLQRRLEVFITAEGVPGAVVGVWSPEGEWIHPAGVADVESGTTMKPGDIFPIRSVTKSMTVTMIQQLVEEHELSLDDPISMYVKGVPNGDEITLRQLAGMTSGLADYSQSPEFGKALTKDPDAPRTVRELLSFALDEPPNFAPGARFEYSNTNTLLLGLVVERVTGDSYGDALEKRIFEPAGMTHTSYPADGEVPDPHPVGYQLDDEGEPQPVTVNLTALGPAGGVVSAVSDLGRYAKALFDGTLISRGSLKERMAHGRQPGPHDPEYDAYGLGLGELAGWWGHTGEGLGFEALVMHDLKTDRTVVILMNLTGTKQHVPTQLFRTYAFILR